MKNEEIIVQEIVNSAKKLMQQYGLRKTTMEDIAKAAGKSKSTLYYYFKDKEDIFDRVIQLEIDEFSQTVENAVNKESDSESKLKTYIITKINTLKEKKNLFRLVIEDDFERRISRKFAGLRNKYDNEERMMISSILVEGVETGLFDEEIMSEIDILSNLLVSCVRGIEMDIIIGNKNQDLANKADLLIEILINGIGK